MASPFGKSIVEQSLIPNLENPNFINDILSDKNSLLTNKFYSLPKAGSFIKRDFVFPNGRGTVTQYSNKLESSNNDIPLFNTRLNPMENASEKKMQFIDSQNNFMDAMFQRIKSISEIQKNANYPSEIQKINNDLTINEKSISLVDLADNLYNSNTNKKQEPQQKQYQQEEQYTNNRPKNSQNINKNLKDTSLKKSYNLSEKQINKIRNQVFERSNYYRRKYKLPEFTIDEQVSTPI